jgi:hypothetical protein
MRQDGDGGKVWHWHGGGFIGTERGSWGRSWGGVTPREHERRGWGGIGCLANDDVRDSKSGIRVRVMGRDVAGRIRGSMAQNVVVVGGRGGEGAQGSTCAMMM